VHNDLDALSVNMADDLMPFLALVPDSFEISDTLLRLDKYENGKFAAVFDNYWQQQEEVYLG
jgi:hypothetical protein